MRALILLLVLLLASPTLAAGFPVTVRHMHGETVVAAAPQRIVSLGYNDQDFLYALGIAPVAVHEWWGNQPYATWPWAEPARAALGAEPVVLDTPETNLEWVAAQRPDLIVAVYYDLDRATYDQLSRIAPVIAAPAGYDVWQAPWQDQLQLIDLATTGDTTQAAKIVADLDARTATARAAYPQLADRTAAVADLREGQFTLWSAESAPTRFLSGFGLVLPEELDGRADDAGWIRLSPELIDLIDLDAVVWPNSASVRAEVEAMPLYQSLRLNTEGRSVWLDDSDGSIASALWFQSPLSIGYIIERLPPMLAAAIDGDPATDAP